MLPSYWNQSIDLLCTITIVQQFTLSIHNNFKEDTGYVFRFEKGTVEKKMETWFDIISVTPANSLMLTQMTEASAQSCNRLYSFMAIKEGA